MRPRAIHLYLCKHGFVWMHGFESAMSGIVVFLQWGLIRLKVPLKQSEKIIIIGPSFQFLHNLL